MAMWNPFRGCHKYSNGCKNCYIHKGDKRRGVDTNIIVKTNKFYAPIEKNKKNEYKMKGGQIVYVCFSSDFLIEEADEWRKECFLMMKERSDLNFIFLTKRIDRFDLVKPNDWADGYDNVTIGCDVEDKESVEYRLNIFSKLKIKHKNIICQPLIEEIDIEKYLDDIELVVAGGESDKEGRVLDFDWIINLSNQCKRKNVPFEFRQCATNFIKDKKFYKLKTNELMSQAKKAASLYDL